MTFLTFANFGLTDAFFFPLAGTRTLPTRCFTMIVLLTMGLIDAASTR